MDLKISLNSFIRESFRTEAASDGRMRYADLAKGICMLFIVYAHVHSNDYVHPVFGLMSLPAFFVLSGMFFRDYGSAGWFVVKKTNRLVIPFLFFTLLGIVGKAVVQRTLDAEDFLNPFFGTENQCNAPVWFLLSLTVCNVLFYITFKLVRHDGLRVAVTLLCGAVGFCLSRHDIFLPFYLSSSLTAMPLIGMGYAMSVVGLTGMIDRLGRFCLPAGVAIILCLMVIYPFVGSPYLELNFNVINGNVLINYSYAAASVLALMMICRGLGDMPFVGYIGRYSLIVLGMHWLWLSYSYLPFYAAFGWQPSADVLFAVAVVLSWVSIPVLRAWVPGLVAQKDLVRLPRGREAVGVGGD